MKTGILGTVLFFIGLWGGSWGFDKYGNTWMGFPFAISACAIMIISIIQMVFGFGNYIDKRMK